MGELPGEALLPDWARAVLHAAGKAWFPNNIGEKRNR